MSYSNIPTYLSYENYAYSLINLNINHLTLSHTYLFNNL